MDKYLLALSQVDGLGSATLIKLIKQFGSAEALFKASVFDLKKYELSSGLIDLIKQAQKIETNDLIKEIDREQLSVCSYYDECYPKMLKEIFDPPILFYYRGNLKLADKPALAVVGSRRISGYAQQIMPKLLQPVIESGITIVSGLAYGVDGLSHQLALEYGGQTIAVVGSGLGWNRIYPPGNVKLAQKIIAQNGLLISENPPLFEALPFTFPRRNRIISGLAKATLIVEAAQKSGALITAACAAEQNREVLAVPQNIYSPTSAGVNNLLKNGAKAVTSAEDILEIFNLKADININNPVTEKMLVELNNDEKTVYNSLSASPVHIDKIIENCNLNTSLVNSWLVQLEIKGLIKNLGNQNYVKT
ncbi:MAG: DNA-processing protein DprA [Candidatus Komeilibacteria bacterium]|nr:DNA-processing protein DprA [Candidatus Komeilibacteria bacterium]